MPTIEEPASQYTDHLLFRATEDAPNNDFVAGWNGEWPPPAKLTTARGLETGHITAFDPAELDPIWQEIAETEPTIVLTRYYRYSASELPEPAPPGKYYFRGALYLREVPDAQEGRTAI